MANTSSWDEQAFEDRWQVLYYLISQLPSVCMCIDIREGKRDWKRPYIIYGKPAFNPRYCCIGISMHVCGVFVRCLWLVSEFHYS